MVYSYKISKYLDRVLVKLKKKDKTIWERILNKINEIINSEDVEHYKNLKDDMKEYKRIHVGSFVLVFKFDKENNLIYFTDFDHHDNIY